MATSDPIADMLTRVRNAARVGRKTVNIKRNRVCVGIAKVLQEEGYIDGFDQIDDANQGEIRIHLKRGERGEHVLQSIVRESKPGCRVYRSVRELPRVLDGLGIAIVSTNRGVMSDRRCRMEKVGGEVLCTVW
ncbi:MAG: 30S ribosomal protein S8 [Phycisphaerae bacterium]